MSWSVNLGIRLAPAPQLVFGYVRPTSHSCMGAVGDTYTSLVMAKPSSKGKESSISKSNLWYSPLIVLMQIV